MQIQKGLVKYKDRSDIVCTYGLVDGGKQYYFLDGNALSNGNIVASTVLVEAIDPLVVASSVGLIDSKGNIVIPFENRMIKPISDKFLLVEKADITTPSIIEAISLRSDPLAATKLVTTPATIKDKIYAKMGNDGKYLFNDQFSEATICDIDGKNVLNNEFYSFIAVKNNMLYLCKNTVDSSVLEFSLDTLNYVEEKVESSLDVSNVSVSKDTIDKAMNDNNSRFGDKDITAVNFEAMNEEKAIDSEMPIVDEEISDNTLNSDAQNNKIEEMYSENTTDKAMENMDSVSENRSEDNGDGRSGRVNLANILDEAVAADPISTDEYKDVKVNSKGLVSFDFGDNINYDEEDEKPNDEQVWLTGPIDQSVVEEETVLDNDEDKVSEFKRGLKDIDLEANDIFANSKVQADSIDSTSIDFEAKKDTIIDDVATTMSNLIKMNRSQRDKINAYEERINQIVDMHKKVVDKARSQLSEMESLKGKAKEYETMVERLESKVAMLEAKIQEQDRLINNQSGELDNLRPQVAGKQELAKILADAQSFLDQEV